LWFGFRNSLVIKSHRILAARRETFYLHFPGRGVTGQDFATARFVRKSVELAFKFVRKSVEFTLKLVRKNAILLPKLVKESIKWNDASIKTSLNGSIPICANRSYFGARGRWARHGF
jgi:hypothetical protein